MIEIDQAAIEGESISIDDITALADALYETACQSCVSSDIFIKEDNGND